MENFTQEEINLIKDYLKAEVALDKHLDGAKRGYTPKFTDADKQTAAAVRTHFAKDDADFILSPAYRPELIKAFLG